MINNFYFIFNLMNVCLKVRQRPNINQQVGYKDESFILASQAKQVFYVTNPENKKLFIVLQRKKQKDGDPILNLDDTPPFTTNPPIASEVLDFVDDEDYAARNMGKHIK